MSRSYKHTPIIKIPCGNSRLAKRQAAKRARRIDLTNGSLYKHVYESWNIWDYRLNFYRRFRTGRDMYTKLPPNMEDVREYWNK